MNRLPIILLIILTTTLQACGPSHVSRVVEVDSSLATTEWLDNEIGFVRNNTVHSYLNRLIIKLSKSVHKTALDPKVHKLIARDYRAYPWQVFLLKSDSLNALSSGAGAIYITEGMLNAVNSESELAAILAHEMAHQLLEHPRAALSKAGAGLTSPELSFSLKQELHADSLGVQILKVSGYDPRAALAALNYGYRLPGGGVAVKNKNLDTRIANIFLQIGENKALRFATRSNSREFTRIKLSLR